MNLSKNPKNHHTISHNKNDFTPRQADGFFRDCHKSKYIQNVKASTKLNAYIKFDLFIRIGK